MSFTIEPAQSGQDFASIGELFREYAEQLGIDLTFQGFQSELAALPGKYAQPSGQLYLARRTSDSTKDPLLGCIGLAPFAKPGACEMKRLYVRKAARGSGIGRALAEAVVEFAISAGYREMLLDTLPSMAGAITIYRSLGFEAIPPYYHNPVPGALFFSKNLKPRLETEPAILASKITEAQRKP